MLWSNILFSCDIFSLVFLQQSFSNQENEKKITKRTNEKRRSMSSKLNAIVTVSVFLLLNMATIVWSRTMVTIVKYWLFCFINLVNAVVGNWTNEVLDILSPARKKINKYNHNNLY